MTALLNYKTFQLLNPTAISYAVALYAFSESCRTWIGGRTKEAIMHYVFLPHHKSAIHAVLTYNKISYSINYYGR